jgi:hypothetical protein
MNQSPVMEKYKNPDMRVSFEYRVSPDGYTLIYSPMQFGNVASGGIEYSHIELFNTVEYTEFTNSTDAREGPRSISIRAYEADTTSLREWVMAHPESSQYASIRDTIQNTTIGSIPAIHYIANGLYNDEVYVLKYKNKIYIIEGMYDDVADQIYIDYKNILKNIQFI